MAGSGRINGEDKTMADLPEASENLVAASAPRYAPSAWPVAGEFWFPPGAPELLSIIASGMPWIAIWTAWPEEMNYRQSRVMFSRRNKAKEKCSALTGFWFHLQANHQYMASIAEHFSLAKTCPQRILSGQPSLFSVASIHEQEHMSLGWLMWMLFILWSVLHRLDTMIDTSWQEMIELQTTFENDQQVNGCPTAPEA
jgi:hypothetical protein